MTPAQRLLRDRIVAAAESAGVREVTYRTEWLGYLPFGAYQWIECADSDLRDGLPSGWSFDDLVALENAGVLERTSEWQNPDDEHERSVVYRLVLA